MAGHTIRQPKLSDYAHRVIGLRVHVMTRMESWKLFSLELLALSAGVSIPAVFLRMNVHAITPEWLLPASALVWTCFLLLGIDRWYRNRLKIRHNVRYVL